MSAASTIRIRLLGTFRIVGQHGEFHIPCTRKAQSLLVLLSLDRETPMPRARAAQLLWPLNTSSQALHNLRQTLLLLQRHFKRILPDQPLLEVTPTQLKLTASDRISLDVAEFLALRKTCQTHPHRNLAGCMACQTRLQALLGLYDAELLAHWNPDEAESMAWLQGWRNTLHQHAIEAAQLLVTSFERQGAIRAAETVARRWTELAPHQEEAHRALMRLLALDGRRAAAIRHYERVESVLADQEGGAPEPETAALFDHIWLGKLLEGHPASVVHCTSAVLPPLTPFFGRQDTLARLEQLLQDASTRLIVLTGVAGSGTTRLAWEAIRQWGWSFRGGVHFCAMQASPHLTTLKTLVRSLARPLRPPDAPSGPTRLERSTRLDALIVLDHADDLLDLPGARSLLDELMTHSTVLLTTHQLPLVTTGEVLTIQGLSLPSEAGLKSMQASEAMQLLTDRIQRVRGLMEVPAEWLRPMAEICWLVEGLPWWLELAAHQLTHHSIDQVLQRLRTAPDTLTLELLDVAESRRSPVQLARDLLNHLPTELRPIVLELAHPPARWSDSRALTEHGGGEVPPLIRLHHWLDPTRPVPTVRPAPLRIVLQSMTP